jgi:fructan beta-fructosidase
MNDPNGLVYRDGTYHLFHQYNPQGNDWGHMSWYHATSPDLVHWTHQGVAIPEEEDEMVFSGSAVVDHENTTGFGDAAETPPMVAIYTSHYAEGTDAFNQAQSLAYSVDGGNTWTKYAGNPVLDHDDPEFRDPNVFWHAPTGRWIMAVALSTQLTVQFYASDDLRTWTHLSNFGPAGPTEDILEWECPVLFPVPVEGEDRSEWVLEVGVNPGAVAGGSGSQYFVGDFDGTAFTPHDGVLDTAPHWVDYGPDFYAALPWNQVPDVDGRALWLGWMHNWVYAKQAPTSPWRGALTLPRSVTLREMDGPLRLVQTPVAELTSLRTRHSQREAESLSGTMRPFADDRTPPLELIAEIAPGDADTVGIRLEDETGTGGVVGYDAAAGTVFVTRTGAPSSSLPDAFSGRTTAPLALSDGRVTLRVIVDRSSVEVFANNGARVLTHRLFPSAPDTTSAVLFADGGSASLVRLDAWSLSSIWASR